MTARAWMVGAILLVGCGGVSPIRSPYNLGVYFQSQQDWDQAVTHYRQALEEDPGDQQARVNLALVHEQKAWALRRDELEGAETHQEAAELLYREALKRDPLCLPAALNLSTLLSARGAREEGRELLTRLATARPDEAPVLTALGAHDLSDGELTTGVAFLERSVVLDDTRLVSWYLLGFGRERLDQIPEAMTAYRRALAISPDDQASALALARLELASGECPAARAHLEAVLLQAPLHVEAHLALATLCEREGNLEAAVRHLWDAREGLPPGPRLTAVQERLSTLYPRLVGQ